MKLCFFSSLVSYRKQKDDNLGPAFPNQFEDTKWICISRYRNWKKKSTKKDGEKSNLFQIAESFINSKNRVKCLDKRKQRRFPDSIHSFYATPFHQSISTLEKQKPKRKKKSRISSPTMASKNMQSNHGITRVCNFDQSPREQFFAGGVHLHPHHHRAATRAAASGGFSGGIRLQHFLR